MPVVVVGFKEAQRAMARLQPELKKNLTKEIRLLLNPIVKSAKGYVIEPTGLTNWTVGGKARQITKASSAFNVNRASFFPLFQASRVKSGIKAQIFATKPTRSGFVSDVRIVNLTAAGAIYETAGRKNPGGQSWHPKDSSHDVSHSDNPKAGKHFIDSLGLNNLKGTGNYRGRLIYRAWSDNQGKALGHILKAIEATAVESKRIIAASKVVRLNS